MFAKLLANQTRRTSPFSSGTTFENFVVQMTESSCVIDVLYWSRPKNVLQSLSLSAKYCHGNHVLPLSGDLSRTKTPGRGELPILMKT